MSARPLQLTDLDDHHCLASILANLYLDDLLNVADTNKQMRAAAQVALGQKYTRQFKLFVDTNRFQPHPGKQSKLQKNNCIRSSDVRFLLRFFRCFGQYVSQLTLFLRNAEEKATTNVTVEKIHTIFKYANQFSNISLKKLQLDNQTNADFPFDCAEHSFVNVVEVALFARRWKLSKEQFKWFFPKVHKITYRSKDVKCLEQHFPQLTSMDLQTNGIFYTSEISEDQMVSIIKCFRCNPQLRQLQLYHPGGVAHDLIRSAAELLPSLEYLNVHAFRPEQPSAHFKNVKTFVQYEAIDKIPLTFERLEQVESYCRTEFDHQRFGDFIRRNPTLTGVTAYKKFFDETNISQIVPSIREITICDADEITSEEATALMNKMPTIITFNFIFCVYDRQAVADQFKTLCGNQWQMFEREIIKSLYSVVTSIEIKMKRR